MKTHWLAVIRDHDLSVARIAVGKNNDMKVMFLSEYTSPSKESPVSGAVSGQDFSGIKTWLQRNRVPLKKLKLSVSSLGLITRVISLPQMTNDDLEMLITDHIDQYFTLNVRNYIIDYRILNKYWENEKPVINVLLAAFPRERMESVWQLCQYLGFEPMVVDLTADCLARLYAKLTGKVQKNRSPDSEQGAFPGDIAVVSLHKDKVEFVLLDNGTFFLYSDMELDLQAVADRYDRLQKLEQKVRDNLSDQAQESRLPVDTPDRQDKLVLPEDICQDNEPILTEVFDRPDAMVEQNDIISEQETQAEDTKPEEESEPEDTIPVNKYRTAEEISLGEESIPHPKVQSRWGSLIFAPDTGEIKLNLSSYTDDIELISAREAGYDNIQSSYPEDLLYNKPAPEIDNTSEPVPADNLPPAVDAEDTLEVWSDNGDELSGPAAWYERDQLLNQLIGLEESNQDQLPAQDNIKIFDWDSEAKSFFSAEETNEFAGIPDNLSENMDSQRETVLPEDSAADLFDVDRMFFDGIGEEFEGLFTDAAKPDFQLPEGFDLGTDGWGFNAEEEETEQPVYQDESEEQSRPNQEDLFDLTDDAIFLDLAKALPQLDFSINSQLDGRPEPIELLDLGKADSILTEEESIPPVNNFFDAEADRIDEEENQDEEVNEDGEEKEEEPGFRQAAISISPAREPVEEFVLEDLFVPLENLDEELAITQTKQDLAKQDNFMEQLTEEPDETSPAEIRGQNDTGSERDFYSEGDLQLNSLFENDNEELTSLDSFDDNINQNQDIFDSLADLQEISLGDIPELSFSEIPEAAFDAMQISQDRENRQLAAETTGDFDQPDESNGQDPEDNFGELQALDEDQPTNSDNGLPSLQALTSAGERNIFDNLDLTAMMGGTEDAVSDQSNRSPKEELEISLSPVLATLSELLSFFAARHFGQTVHTVYLTGEYGDLPGLEEIFQENLGIRTKAGFPKNWKPQFEGGSKALAAQWQKHGSLYGLALRED